MRLEFCEEYALALNLCIAGSLLTTKFLRISPCLRFAELRTAELRDNILITVAGHIYAALLTSTCPDSSVNTVTRLRAGEGKSHCSSHVTCGVSCFRHGQHQLQGVQSYQTSTEQWRTGGGGGVNPPPPPPPRSPPPPPPPPPHTENTKHQHN